MPSCCRHDRLQEGAAACAIEGTDVQHDRPTGENYVRAQWGSLPDAGFIAGQAKTYSIYRFNRVYDMPDFSFLGVSRYVRPVCTDRGFRSHVATV